MDKQIGCGAPKPMRGGGQFTRGGDRSEARP